MYKFLVVEDEQYIRDSVSSLLEELNGGGVLRADNGVSALYLIDQERVDAVIADMQMPVMDGISLLKIINARNEHPIVAILSGHDEFDYVQAAIKYGAIDYILKPFDKSDISKLYYIMVRKLRAKERLNFELESLMQKANEIKPFIRQRFFQDIVTEKIEESSFTEMKKFLNLNVGENVLRISLIEVDKEASFISSVEGQSQLSLYNILSTITQIIKEWRYIDVFEVSNKMLAVIWSPPDTSVSVRDLFDDLELLIKEMSSLYGIVLNIGVGIEVDNILQAGKAYESAGTALKNKLIYGVGQVFDETKNETLSSNGKVAMDATDVIDYIWRNEPYPAIRKFEHCFSEMALNERKYRLSSVQLFCQKILTDCLIVLERESNGFEQINTYMKCNCIEKRFSDCSNVEIIAFFKKLIPEICKEIGQNRNNERKSIVQKAKKIIAANYQTPITMSSLSQELHFSKNYLGQIFKNETGMNVNEYINQVRIQKAKELIASKNYKMYQVSEMIGFNDQQYFAKVFKKIVGCMPSEYRS